ncbi:Rieske (2Fe-2S) protein [Streptomyces monomycini]|uniref:Rieske (2Fe-2S) protein n=1 Tax=Streptomyces monomycini TaxID=371720 RepID=UPI000998399E|nr:Rieske (2Fe-2S) protein [Streptomyces monomycini]
MTQRTSTGRSAGRSPGLWTDARTARRTVVAAAGAAGLAAALAACGNGSDGYGDSASSAPPDASKSDGGGGGDGSKNGDTEPGGKAPGSAGTGAAGGVLARTTDIPEGGGKVFKDRKVVVTQPAKGEFKAFSAVCRHQGCLVNEVADGTINCPCHGSTYAIADGSVRNGPATQGLVAAKVSVEGDAIKLG